jgi:hypothetical protein
MGGIRRSEIRGGSPGYVVRKQDFLGIKTKTGEIQFVVKGAYEIVLEVMASKASTGLVVNEKGMTTIWCRSGVLNIRHMEFKGEGEGEEQTSEDKYSRLNEGDFRTIPPGQPFELSTGEAAVDFIRIQTPNYFEGIEQLVDGVAPEKVDVTVGMHNLPPEGHKIPSPTGVPQRASSDPNYRKKIAEQRNQDRSSVAGRKKVTREVRQPRSRQQVLNQNQFVDPRNQQLTQASKANPEPMGAELALAEEAAAQQEAMAYLEAQRVAEQNAERAAEQNAETDGNADNEGFSIG